MMKKLTPCFLSIVLFLISDLLPAQKFLKPQPGHRLTFTEMQQQFTAWSKTVDLSTEKNWKYYKRWEHEMLLHTDAKGEPGDPGIYLQACIQAAQDKQRTPTSAFSSSAWMPLGPNALPGNNTGYMENGIGRINCIAFHPTDSATYFVGVAQGGVWKTNNYGLSWIPLTDNLPITRISDISIDPANPNTMYISVGDFEYIDVGLKLDARKRNTHYGLGVYKTTDGGMTWQPTGLSFQLTNGDFSLIRKVLVNPTNSNQLVACGVSGMYTSTDAGSTWTHRLDSLFWDIQADPVSPQTLYAASGWLAVQGFGNAAIYKSIDFGVTWTMLNTGIPPTGTVQRIRLAIAPSDHTCIYALAVDAASGFYGVYKSTDSGLTWQFLSPSVNIFDGSTGTNAGGQGTYDLGFTVSATDKNTVYAGGVNVYVSTDGAATFNPASYWMLQYGPTLHGDIHFIERQPLTGNLFACSDGGVYRTKQILPQPWSSAMGGTPWPTQWTKISNGLTISSFYRISSSKTTDGRLVAGAQDNGTFYFNGTGWSTIMGGDGMDNYLDPVDPNYIIGSSQYGNFMCSTDGGLTSNSVNCNIMQEAAEWTSPFSADFHQSGVFYIGLTNVTKSSDHGSTWNTLSPLPSNGISDNEISALAVSSSNGNVLYAARRIRYEKASPTLMATTSDGGNTWTNITPGLPDSLYITSTDISQTDPNTAYVAYAGFSSGVKVFKTGNGGGTWQNISYNLPNIPVNCIKTVPGHSGILIATDLGVYFLGGSATTWQAVSTGLPNVIVDDLDFNPALNTIYASTFGRGIWQADLNAIVGITENQKENSSLELFPSLNDGSFTIGTGDHQAGTVFQLDVIDITGRNVYSASLRGQKSYEEHLTLPSGMYFARLKSSYWSGVKSFVVK